MIQQQLTEAQLKKAAQGLCIQRGCRHKRDGSSRLCAKHKARRLKEKNPLAYCYKALKSNAKRRGKEFSLSINYFKSFCDDTSYLNERGRRFSALSIDRIDNSLGYIPGNIRAITCSENSSKRNTIDYANAPF